MGEEKSYVIYPERSSRSVKYLVLEGVTENDEVEIASFKKLEHAHAFVKEVIGKEPIIIE